MNAQQFEWVSSKRKNDFLYFTVYFVIVCCHALPRIKSKGWTQKKNGWAINNNKWRNLFKHKKWTELPSIVFFSPSSFYFWGINQVLLIRSLFIAIFFGRCAFFPFCWSISIWCLWSISIWLDTSFKEFLHHFYFTLTSYWMCVFFASWKWCTRQKKQHNHSKYHHNSRPLTSLNQLGEC